MKKQVLVFGHSDLDGAGVQIIGEAIAQAQGLPCETYRCSYHDANSKIMEAIRQYTPQGIAQILIGDISVNKETATQLCELNKQGVEVILRDHHQSAEWLNCYCWAYVAENEDGVSHCGTYLLAREFYPAYVKYRIFIETVDSWDVWTWKETNNTAAKDLNSLFQIMGTQDFIQYIKGINMDEVHSPEDLFTDEARRLIEFYDRSALKTAQFCESFMWTADFKFPRCKRALKGGVVFCNNYISDVAEYILTNHPEIDFLMLCGMPRSISFRTQKQLPISLAYVAKYMTGSGGGHPQASGAVLTAGQFKDMFTSNLNILSGGSVGIHNLGLYSQQDPHKRG